MCGKILIGVSEDRIGHRVNYIVAHVNACCLIGRHMLVCTKNVPMPCGHQDEKESECYYAMRLKIWKELVVSSFSVFIDIKTFLFDTFFNAKAVSVLDDFKNCESYNECEDCNNNCAESLNSY